LHAAGIVANRAAPGMLRTINRAGAVARAICQSAGEAKGKFERKNDQQAKNQSHGDPLYEVNGGHWVAVAYSLTPAGFSILHGYERRRNDDGPFTVLRGVAVRAGAIASLDAPG
jgi:hypothetical protein